MDHFLGAHRKQDWIVIFGDYLVRSLGLLFYTKVDVDCLGVGVSTVDGITEVHKEGRALPSQAVLDVRVRKICSVEEIGGRDLD